MVSPGEISLLCRLCLVKDQVNVPIFGEQGDIRQIFLKISSCLPVTVSKEDQLPKNICEGCSDKLDLLFAFWNSSRDAEKTLVSWLKQASVDNANETINAIAKQISAKPVAEVKQETDDGQNIKIQQSSEEGKNDESEEAPPPPKRARRTAAVKAQISISQEDESEEEEDDVDAVEPLTKVEDESDMSDNDGADNQPLSSFVDMPGTSADDQEQAGPSGVGKDGGADAPLQRLIIKQEPDANIKEEVPRDPLEEPYQVPEQNLEIKLVKESDISLVCCQKGFLTISDLRAHLLRCHDETSKFSCDTSFRTDAVLKKHTKVGCFNVAKTYSGLTSDPAPALCPPKTSKVSLKKISYQRVTPKPSIPNKFPSIVAPPKPVLPERHSPKSLQKFLCGECDKSHHNFQYLANHMLTVHKIPIQKCFKCHFCRATIYFLHVVLLNKHISEDHGVGFEFGKGFGDFRCGDCGATFGRGDMLRKHMATHNSNNKHWGCVIKKCRKLLFSNWDNLVAHHKDVHNRTLSKHHNTPKVVPPKLLKPVNELVVDKPMFTVEKVFSMALNSDCLAQCFLCNERFGSNAALKKHMFTRHPQERLVQQELITVIIDNAEDPADAGEFSELEITVKKEDPLEETSDKKVLEIKQEPDDVG